MSKKPVVSEKYMERIHPYIPEAYNKLKQGRVTRREFIRMATLLGMSASTALIAAQCGAPAQPEQPAQSGAQSSGAEAEPTKTQEEVAEAEEKPAEEEQSAEEAAAPSGSIKRGGTLTRAMLLQLIDHPARLSWVEGANIVRQVGEYLTETGPDNITRPFLLEKWEASEDVKTWTLYLNKGVKFNNGDELTADDVIFTFGEWLNPDVGSSMLGLLSYLSGTQDVEKVDDYTIRLNLKEPNIGVPEHLFHYPAIILHRSFEGDFIKQPIGTGAFTLEEYAEAERATFKRRTDYWQMGEDGQPLPYLDEIIYVSIDKDAAVAAMQSGQVDSLHQPRPSDWQALKDVPGITTRTASTAQCFVLRMRVDLEPWTDEKVRNALKMCQDREKILQLSFFGQGDLSIDAHVAPVHPAYCERPIPAYDPEGAKKLLAEAGFPDGLKVTLATKNDEAEPEIAQALKELAAPAGFDITLDITEPDGFWDRWTEVDLGITAWTHRPLDTMVLPLAYIADDKGVPVPWNETRWTDEEFTKLLRQAEGTLDIEARREIMCQIEDIMQQRGPIGNSYWKSVWNITRSEFQNIEAHPTSYDLLNTVWKDA
jgi:peptide/nickel transport system substrate-binding protein